MKRPYLLHRIDHPRGPLGIPSTQWIHFYEDLNVATVKTTHLGSSEVDVQCYGGTDLEQTFAREHAAGRATNEFLDGVHPPRAQDPQEVYHVIQNWFEEQSNLPQGAGYYRRTDDLIDGVFPLRQLASHLCSYLPRWFVPPAIPEEDRRLLERCLRIIREYETGTKHNTQGVAGAPVDVVLARELVRRLLPRDYPAVEEVAPPPLNVTIGMVSEEPVDMRDPLKPSPPPVVLVGDGGVHGVPPVGQRPGPHDTVSIEEKKALLFSEAFYSHEARASFAVNPAPAVAATMGQPMSRWKILWLKRLVLWGRIKDEWNDFWATVTKK